MTRSECDNLNPALRAAAEGRFAAISAEQIAVLTAHVDSCPACAAKLAGARPRADGIVARALADPPREPAWPRIWRAVDAAARPATVMGGRSGPLILRLWAPLTAAAACIGLALAFRGAPQTVASEAWPVRSVGAAEFANVQTPAGDELFLVTSDDLVVLWVDEDAG